jgi:hypothetical protein
MNTRILRILALGMITLAHICLNGCTITFVPNTNNTVADITWTDKNSCVVCIQDSIGILQTQYYHNEASIKNDITKNVCAWDNTTNKFKRQATQNCGGETLNSWRLFLYFFYVQNWELSTLNDQCECQSKCQFLDDEMNFSLLYYQSSTPNPITISTSNGCIGICLNGMYSIPGMMNTLMHQDVAEIMSQSLGFQSLFDGCEDLNYLGVLNYIIGQTEPNFNSPFTFFWTKKFFQKYTSIAQNLNYSSINDMAYNKTLSCYTNTLEYTKIQECKSQFTASNSKCYYVKRTNSNDFYGNPFKISTLGQYGEIMESFYWMNELDRCLLSIFQGVYYDELFANSDYAYFLNPDNYLANLNESECECMTKYHYEYSESIKKTAFQTPFYVVQSIYSESFISEFFGYPQFSYFNSTPNPMNLKCTNEKCGLYKESANLFIYSTSYFEFKNTTECLRSPTMNEIVKFTVKENVETVACNINSIHDHCINFQNDISRSLSINKEAWTCLIGKVEVWRPNMINNIPFTISPCPNNDCRLCRCQLKSTTVLTCFINNNNQIISLNEYDFCLLSELNPGVIEVNASLCQSTQNNNCSQNVCQSLVGYENCSGISKVCVSLNQQYSYITINDFCTKLENSFPISIATSESDKCCQTDICSHINNGPCLPTQKICLLSNPTLITIEQICLSNASNLFSISDINGDIFTCCVNETYNILKLSSKTLSQNICVNDSVYKLLTLEEYCNKIVLNNLSSSSLLLNENCDCKNTVYNNQNFASCCISHYCPYESWNFCQVSSICVNYNSDNLNMNLVTFCDLKSKSNTIISESNLCSTCSSSSYKQQNKNQCCLQDYCSDVNDPTCVSQLLCIASNDEITPKFISVQNYCSFISSNTIQAVQFLNKTNCEVCSDPIYKSLNQFKCCLESSCYSIEGCSNTTNICVQSNQMFYEYSVESYCQLKISNDLLTIEPNAAKCCEQSCNSSSQNHQSEKYCDVDKKIQTWLNYCLKNCTSINLSWDRCFSLTPCSSDADCQTQHDCQTIGPYIYFNQISNSYQFYRTKCDLLLHQISENDTNLFICPLSANSFESCIQARELFVYNLNPHVLYIKCPDFESFNSVDDFLRSYPEKALENYSLELYKCPKPLVSLNAKNECYASFCTLPDSKIITFYNNSYVYLQGICDYQISKSSYNVDLTICCKETTDNECLLALKTKVCNTQTSPPAWNYQNSQINYYSKACLTDSNTSIIDLKICDTTSSQTCAQQFELFKCNFMNGNYGLVEYNGNLVFKSICELRILYPSLSIYDCLLSSETQCFENYQRYICASSCSKKKYDPVCTKQGLVDNKCLATCKNLNVLNKCSDWPNNNECAKKCILKNCEDLASCDISRVCGSDGIVYQNKDFLKCSGSKMVFECNSLQYKNPSIKQGECNSLCKRLLNPSRCRRDCVPKVPVCHVASKTKYSSTCNAECHLKIDYLLCKDIRESNKSYRDGDKDSSKQSHKDGDDDSSKQSQDF